MCVGVQDFFLSLPLCSVYLCTCVHVGGGGCVSVFTVLDIDRLHTEDSYISFLFLCCACVRVSFDSLVDMYSYSDLVRDSSKAANPNNWLSRHVSFDQYNISVDLAAELKAMELRPYSDMFAFHTDILKLFNKLKDAHTTYQAPFSPLRAYLPLWFATKLVSNSSRQVAIVNQVDGRLARMHSDIYGPTEGGLFKLEGKEIAEINGKPAMMYLRVSVVSPCSCDILASQW